MFYGSIVQPSRHYNEKLDADIDILFIEMPHKPSPGGIDVAIRYGTGNWPGLESQFLLPSPVVVVAA